MEAGVADAIAAKNEGSFLNLVFWLREWKRKNLSSIGREQVEEFEGSLAKVFARRYAEAVRVNPNAKFIYAALDILRHFTIAPQRDLVVQVASCSIPPPSHLR